MAVGPLGQTQPQHSSQLTSFVGRNDELAELGRLLESGRLVTITGPGGSGKTRLALELVDRIRSRFPDGAAFVDLAPLDDATLIPSALAAVLDLADEPGRPVIDRIVNRLEASEALLLLDNWEQLLPVGAQVAASILARCRNVRLLATSRIALNLRGEQELRLEPLPVPDGGDWRSVEQLRGNEAIALFVDRARAVNPRLELSSENARAIVAICRRLDGLPLALELAAARTRVLSLEALLQRLDHALPLLTTGPADAPDRLRSLRDAIRWSYDLLAPVERRVFCRLSVFVRGATLDVAPAVVLEPGEGGEIALLDVLERLVDQALVRVAPDPDGEPRFTMLETIREFAAEQLEIDGETDPIRQRHAEAFLALAERAALDRMPPDSHEWYLRFEREHDNLRSAMVWYIERGDEARLRLVSLLYRFWLSRDHSAEARIWVDAALDHARERATADAAGVLRAAAMLAYAEGRPLDGLDDADRSYRLFEQLGDRPGAAITLLNRGRIAAAAGLADRARASYRDAIRLADELDLPAVKAAAIANLAVGEMDAGHFAEAVTLLRDSLEIARRHNSLEWIAFAADNLAGALVVLGDHEGALTAVRECVTAARSLGALLQRTGHVLRILAAVAAGIGEGRLGARLLPVSDRLLRSPGSAPEPFSGNLRASTERALRAQLGSTYDAAFESGRSSSIDDAIAEALSMEIPTMPRPGLARAVTPHPGTSRHDLTPREREVVALVAAGWSDGEIADALFISKKTASVHVANIKSKLEAASRVEIALTAQKLGLAAALTPHDDRG